MSLPVVFENLYAVFVREMMLEENGWRLEKLLKERGSGYFFEFAKTSFFSMFEGVFVEVLVGFHFYLLNRIYIKC